MRAPDLYTDCPIHNNHAFLPSLMDPGFARWKEGGAECLRDLYLGGYLMSFEQVRSKFNLTATYLFRYLHIQSFIRTHIHTYADIPCHEALEGILKVEPGSRGAVSILYQTLMRQEVVSTEKQQAELEAEIGVPVTEEVWETCLENIHRCSGNARLNLIQFKVIHRLHYSKVKVNKMYPSVSELCNKCNSQPGTLTHQFWSCPNLHSY